MAAALYVALAVTLLAGAALLAYLAAPRQSWRRRPLPARPARGAALLLGLAGAGAWGQALELSTTLFSLLTLLMALFVALPLLGVLRELLRGAR